jgi:hypothetical protein
VGLKLIPDVSVELIGEKADQGSNTATTDFDFGIGLEWKKDF